MAIFTIQSLRIEEMKNVLASILSSVTCLSPVLPK